MHKVTRVLKAVDQGDPQATEQLLPLVYDELCKLAAQKRVKEKPGQTLQATALVHEAYLTALFTSTSSWPNVVTVLSTRRGAGRRIKFLSPNGIRCIY